MSSKRFGILLFISVILWGVTGPVWFFPSSSQAPGGPVAVGLAQAGYPEQGGEYNPCAVDGDPDSYANSPDGDPDGYTRRVPPDTTGTGEGASPPRSEDPRWIDYLKLFLNAGSGIL